MVSLAEFMATEKPKRRSKLEPFKDDILTLKQNGYSELSIVKYLESNGLTVSQRTVNQFIVNNRDKEIISSAENVASQPKHNKEKKISSEENKASSAPRKFDWQTPIDETEMQI